MWLVIVEPLLRRWPGYPPDWERRRLAIYERGMGRCERCGLPCGRIGLCGKSWRVIAAHIHHMRAIAEGGGHELANLQVRCIECHRAEHPENSLLGKRRGPV
jgi:5-methylcytosine-specific restriction endonuclease McrA